MKRLAIISDTHNLLRPQVLERLAAADIILHAGDVSSPDTLEALQDLGKDLYLVRATTTGPGSPHPPHPDRSHRGRDLFSWSTISGTCRRDCPGWMWWSTAIPTGMPRRSGAALSG